MPYAYIASYVDDALTIFDITTPGTPTHAGYIRGAGTPNYLNYARSVYVVGDYAFVSSALDNSLSIFDISDPTNPTLEGFVRHTAENKLGEPYGLWVQGNYAYITSYTQHALTIFDISDPTNPTHVGEIHGAGTPNFLGNARDVHVIGDYAYVIALGDDALTIFNISNPTNPTHAGTIKAAAGQLSNPLRLYVEGDYAYIASNGNDSLVVIDVSDPANPSFRGKVTSSSWLNLAQDVWKDGDYCYVTWDNGLTIVDVSTPGSPSIEGYIYGSESPNWLAGATEVFVDGDFAYIAAYAFDAFTIIDISNKASPSHVASISQGDGSPNWLNGAVGISPKHLRYPKSGVIVEITDGVTTVDISDYILAIHTERGEDAELAEATSGVCQLTCDNRNGDFSPENVAGAFYPILQIGVYVVVFEIYEYVKYNIFKVRIDNIDPLAEKGNPYAYINVLDGMDDMKGTKISTALRINTESGELADDVLDAVAWPAGDRNLDAGVDVLQLGWFHKIDALEAIRVLERVENGRFFISPVGIATWHNRHHRLTGDGLVSQYDFAEKSIELDYEYTKRLVKNVINLRGRRYYAGGGATLFSGYDLATLEDDLIWSAHAGDAGAPYVPQQTSLTLWADMNSPLAAYDTLVKGTHWNANTVADKSGVDVTADISLVQTQYGQSVKMVFTNNGTVGAWLVVPDTPPAGAPEDRTALVYGTLYGEEVMALTDEDATSQTLHGIRSLDLDLPFKSNPNDIVSYAQYLKRKYKDPVPRAVSAKIAHRTDWPDTSIKIQCLTREIGDRITLASSRLGFDRDFYINKVVQDYAFNEGGLVAETTWYIERAAGTVEEIFWILGEVGFSEIGETTVLGF